MRHRGRTPWPPELSGQLREVDRLRRGGRYERALACIRQLAEAHPTQVRVLLEMGLTLGIWGRAPAEALPWFDRILELAPGHLTTRLHRALTLARLGRHTEAIADFNTVESMGHRRQPILYVKRAESLRALGHHAEAERDWTRALAQDPGNPWLLQQRAQARAQQGRLTEALQDLSDALAPEQEEPVDPELLRDRAVLRARLGDIAGARADLEAGLSGQWHDAGHLPMSSSSKPSSSKPSSSKPVFTERQALFDTFRTHVNRGKVETFERYGFDAIMGRRQGATFQDAFDSRSWLNAHCNGGVFNLGHRHPAVLAAVRAALEEVDIGNHHLPSPWRAELARRLAATTGGRLSGVVFGVSGGEAVDLAIKVARAATGRQRIVSASGGYHGHTGLALATGDARYRERFGPNLPGFVQVPFNELAALERAVDEDTAAVLLETIPATLGMPIPTEGYLASVQALCRQRGAKLLLDEVQTGLGRTGRMWAYQHDGLEPDAIVVGKGLSGGIYPITATLMTPELHALFDEEPFIHISTFGGAEPGCAAGLAVLDVVEEPGFLEHVNQLAAFFRESLSGLPFELRQRGLMMGLKFEAEGVGMMATKVLFDAGLFTVYANNDTSVLQFLPPLVTTREEAARMVEILRRAFA